MLFSPLNLNEMIILYYYDIQVRYNHGYNQCIYIFKKNSGTANAVVLLSPRKASISYIYIYIYIYVPKCGLGGNIVRKNSTIGRKWS